MENTERYQMMVESICQDHDCLTLKQQEKLGELLAMDNLNGSDAYGKVVDFLYETEEIDLSTRCDLLDLA